MGLFRMLIIFCAFIMLISCSTHVDDTKKVVLSNQQLEKVLIDADNYFPFEFGEKYTLEEVYETYGKYFTKKYVDKILLKTFFVEKNNKFSLSEANVDLLPGVFYEPHFSNKTTVNQTEKLITVTNPIYIEMGLYDSHTEIIKLKLVNGKWKIHDLVWEKYTE